MKSGKACLAESLNGLGSQRKPPDGFLRSVFARTLNSIPGPGHCTVLTIK